MPGRAHPVEWPIGGSHLIPVNHFSFFLRLPPRFSRLFFCLIVALAADHRWPPMDVLRRFSSTGSIQAVKPIQRVSSLFCARVLWALGTSSRVTQSAECGRLSDSFSSTGLVFLFFFPFLSFSSARRSALALRLSATYCAASSLCLFLDWLGSPSCGCRVIFDVFFVCSSRVQMHRCSRVKAR